MKYSFTCPLEGCGQTMTVEAQDNNEAVVKLVNEAKRHLSTVHPDVHKTDEEIRVDVSSQMATA